MALSYKEKLSHLADLMALAHADEETSKIEATYVKVVAKKLGVDMLDLAKIETLGTERDLPENEFQIIPLFHRLLILMNIDMDLDERELLFCRNLGIKMGLNPSAVSEIIELAGKNRGRHLQPGEINEIFKKYCN
ncbi:hypothetical protein E1176_02380 [Fulvivirga sp. RKSG066]|uniref:hypothetical protein n=1 Tax=Fulvivirga aurantia TaxID=2529383 RepID=UPI0012BC6BF8|nr:hypothetical protein [Fulvivirga aurantia]MTI19861.1 hypothetical protein [Fulvivirga aurantia]